MKVFIYSFVIYVLSLSAFAHEKGKDLSQRIFDNYASSYQPEKSNDKQKINKALVALGKKIFFDTRFSDNQKMACGTCHIPEKAFSDNNPKAVGNKGQFLRRKTMTLYHIENDEIYFWDGRGASLEAQFAEAFQNPLEMNFSFRKAIEIMQIDTEYKKLLVTLNKKPSKNLMTDAIIAYEKTIKPPETRFDDWLEGNLDALNTKELRGFEIFNTKADCIACHIGNTFKDGLRNDIGLPDKDLGYGEITKNSDDNHMFKTPTLRGVAYRAPYMHDGSLKTLDDVIDHYNIQEFKRGETDIPTEENQGNVIAFHNFTQPLNLTEQEKQDLIAFLKTL